MQSDINLPPIMPYPEDNKFGGAGGLGGGGGGRNGELKTYKKKNPTLKN